MNAVSRCWGYFKIYIDFFFHSLFSQSAKISASLFVHGISVFVGFRTDSFFSWCYFICSFILLCVLFVDGCSPKKLPSPSAALGHKMDSFSFQMACHLLLSEFGDKVAFKISQISHASVLRTI